MLDNILDLAGAALSAGSGGLFGLIGSGIGAWFKRKQLAADREFEMAMLDKKMAMASTGGSWDALSESLRADAMGPNAPGWAVGIKALFRPFLTIMLWLLAAWTFREMLSAMVEPGHPLATALSATEMKDIIRYMIYSIFFSAVTAGVWWFGDRAFSPPNLKHR